MKKLYNRMPDTTSTTQPVDGAGTSRPGKKVRSVQLFTSNLGDSRSLNNSPVGYSDSETIKRAQSVELLQRTPPDTPILGPDEPSPLLAGRSSPFLFRVNGIYILTFFAAFGGLLFGYDTGIISGSILYVTEDFRLSKIEESWVVSITVFGAAVGALLAGPINDLWGRRLATLLSSLVFIVGALVMGFAPGFVILTVGRLIVGLGIGVASMTSPMYISEVSPPDIRGALVSYNTVAITSGQLIAYLVSAGFAGREHGWRWMLGLSAVPAVMQLIGIMFLPESPRWLVTRERFDDARRSLKFFRPEPKGKLTSALDEEEEIKYQLSLFAANSRAKLSVQEALDTLFGSPILKRALMIAVGLQSFQQLCGINIAMYFSASIIKMAGVESKAQAIFLSTLVALTGVAAAIFAVVSIDRLGRRKLLIASALGATIGLVILGAGFQMSQGFATGKTTCGLYTNCQTCALDNRCGVCLDPVSQSGSPLQKSDWGVCMPGEREGPENSGSCHQWSFEGSCDNSSATGTITVAALILYVFFFNFGLGVVPWTMMSELFPSGVNGIAGGIATASNWICNFAVALTFLPATGAISIAGTFYLYSVIGVIACIFIYVFVPETKGRTLEQIQVILARATGSSMPLPEETDEETLM